MSTQIKKNGNWVTVAGGTRMWVGTKAALQAALDAGELVDGTAVMVTDDYEDANAVVDSPITKVAGVINGDRFWSKRTGNVVEIMIDGNAGCNIPCNQAVAVAKVPKNASAFSDVCIEIDSQAVASETGHKRAWVDTEGNVNVVILLPNRAATYTGNIYIGGTYITSE